MTFDSEHKNNVTVYIDDQACQVSADNNLLAGVLSQKLNLPYFCWHPSMGSVGACRQCAVILYQDENDQRGRLVMACTTPVTDGMRISLQDGQSTEFREQVIAAMMTNHPHDCPVCAEGGECHLQDMTVMTGHTTRTYKGEKRTFNNQYLGEFVGHEMNRCITCYRCVRYYKDFAGGHDFDVYGSKNQVYFGRQQDGQLESEFSGNLVEVCPTGVFTNKLFSAHYTRKWDLQSAPSICGHCALGCNTSVGERYGSVRRVMNRYHHDLNGYFLCDRGRFGIGFVNGKQRIRQVKGIAQHSPDKLTKLDVSRALVHFKGKKFIGIGSGRASFEANYLLKQLVGNENFSLGLNHTQMQLAALHHQHLATNPVPSLLAIEQSDFILIIDEDITQTAPRMALSVRQALRNVSKDKAALLGIPWWQDSAVRTIGAQRLTPLYLLQSKATKLDDVAEQVVLQKNINTIELLTVMTELIASNAELTDLNLDEHHFSSLLNKLVAAKKPLIIGGWASQSPQLLSAITRFIAALKQAQVAVNSVLVPPCANTLGLLSLMDENTLALEQVLAKSEAHESEELDGIILLEQELAQLSDTQLEQLSDNKLTKIAIDHSENRATELADVILACAPVTESDGHFVNYQGLIQAYYQVHPCQLPVQESWRWLTLVGQTLAADKPWAQDFASLTQLHQTLKASDASWPITIDENARKIARESHRASGRTAKMANFSVHEPKATESKDNYCFSMEGSKPDQSADMPFTWAPGWNSNQSISHYQTEVAGQLVKHSDKQCLEFTLNNALYEQWCAQLKETCSEHNFSLQTLWYQGDWQSRLTPEFRLLERGNYFFVSQAFAEQQKWQAGQWLLAKFPADNALQHNGVEHSAVVGQMFIDQRLSDDHVYGQVAQLVDTHVSSIELNEANQQQIAHYQKTHQEQISQAQDEQAEILAQLKQRDQHIPIRLVSGGLDDV